MFGGDWPLLDLDGADKAFLAASSHSIGQSILMGKSLTAGAPFRHVTDLHSGDVITVTTGQSTFRFSVLGLRKGGDPIPQLASGGSLLTLVTSAGSGFLGSLAPSHVVYLDATLQGATAPPPRLAYVSERRCSRKPRTST